MNACIRLFARGIGSAFAALLLLLAGTGTASATADPSGVSFTLQGCRNDGTITLPNAGGKFVCPNSAYTTGNLGKGWNELDLVPHRLTAQAGNSAPTTQTYAIAIAADNCNYDAGSSFKCADNNAGFPGYDVISSDGAGGAPVLNTALSSASCTALSATDTETVVPGVGGLSVSLARVLTITQPKNTTCVYDYYERLALGSHLFPGSSLHSDLLNQNLGTQGIGAKDVSIPVKEISPQSLNKDMSASEGADDQWTVTKLGTPASVSFGDVCRANAPTSEPVSIKVTWTLVQNAGGINVITHVYATNPAARTITTTVTDVIYAGTTQTTALSTSGPVSVDVPANSTVLVMTDTQQFDPVATGLGVGSVLNDVATATYTDKATGIAVPGQTTANAQATITQGDVTNATTDITDEESITGTGLTFSVDSPSTGFQNSYVVGTATTGPVDWLASAQTATGSETFGKTVYLDKARITSGTLSDTAKILLTGTTTQLDSDALSIPISSTASVSLTVGKTIPAILGTGEKLDVTFHIAGMTPAVPGDPTTIYSNDITITFSGGGNTTLSQQITGLLPDSYTVTESGNVFYPADYNAVSNPDSVADVLNPVGGNQKTVDLSAAADGTVANCSGSANFTNAIPQGELAQAQVQKITTPALASTDADYNWTFTLFGPDNAAITAVTAGAGAGYVNFGVNLTAEGTYTVQETTKTPVWVLNSASPNDGTHTTVCSFTVNYPQAEGKTFSCTFQNTKQGKAKVVKTLQGQPPSGTQAFTFQLRQGASSLSDGTTLEQVDANAADGGIIAFTTLLVPGNHYQVCEIVMPGWNTNLGIYGTLFVPNSMQTPTLPNPTVNNMTVCVDFTAAAGTTTTFNVDNSPPPGGRALTIGFWKNWASCTTSSSNKKSTLDATLYGYLPNGIPVGNVKSVVPGHTTSYGFFGQTATSTADCPHAVALLNKSTFGGTKMASDPLFNLAAQLVGAELNQAAGAGVCPKAATTITQANALLSKYNFIGTGYSGKLSSADANLANGYATELDNFNNDRPSACQ